MICTDPKSMELFSEWCPFFMIFQADKSREHETAIEGKLCEQQLLVKDLEKRLVESSENAEEHFKEISKQHQDQVLFTCY